MQILRKRISRKVDGDRETIVNEYFEKDILDNIDIDFLGEHFDDPEEAICNGICYDMEGDLVWIDAEKLMDAIDEELLDKDNLSDFTVQTFKSILERITPWKGYDLWI